MTAYTAFAGVPRALAAGIRAIQRFAFAPARAEPLAALRAGVAAVLLAQAALVAEGYHQLYARSGAYPGPLQDMLARPGLPHVGPLVALLAPAGVGEDAIFAVLGGLYAISLVALLLGLWTRLAAALAWLLHLTLMNTAEGTLYGADALAHVSLFYLIWSPAGAAFSLDRRLGRAPANPSPAARIALRVVQIHLCILYLKNGVSKARNDAWWNGHLIWGAVMSPVYSRFDLSWLANHAWIAVAAGWAVLVVETGYAALIWPRRTRRLWVLATAALHLGIAIFLGLPVFGALMIVLTVAAFGVSAEPRAAR